MVSPDISVADTQFSYQMSNIPVTLILNESLYIHVCVYVWMLVCTCMFPGNAMESEIRLSKNVVYWIGNATERKEHVHVDLIQNSSYNSNSHQVETNLNISYIPNQQAVNMDMNIYHMS